MSGNQLSAEHLNAFIKAAGYTFGAVVGTKAKRKDLKVTPPGEKVQSIGNVPGKKWVVATLAMGGRARGGLVLATTDKVAVTMVAHMLDERIGEMNQTVVDGIGELALMIGGAAQSFMPHDVPSLGKPRVVVDETVRLGLPTNVPSFKIGFDTEYGSFSLDVALDYAPAKS